MVKHFVLTLTTGAQRFSTVLGNTNASGATAEPVPRWSEIQVQGDTAATGSVYIGGYGTLLSTSAWGVLVPPASSSIPAAPIRLGAGRLDEWVALGTADEKLHITVHE